ncbi:20015_t:CDS:2 [Rhizophagus irregularis]|nr:20015_t:CDS:2 [Rhizophagus irregularis]
MAISQYNVMRTTEYYEITYETPLSNQAYIICEIIFHLEAQPDLATCCLVSRLWNTCTTPILWKKPFMKRASTFDKFIRTLVRTRQHATSYAYGCFIQSLDLSRLSCSAGELNLISESCGVLKYLDFSYVRELKDDILSRISGQCSDLKSLKLLNLPNITDHSLMQIINRCHRLEHLAIGDCINIKNDSFLQLAISAEHLVTLEIFIGNTIENDTFMLITQHCLRLKNLHIWDCVAIRCPNIRHLGLEPYEGVTNDTLKVIANYCLRIESFQFTLHKAENISNDGFLMMAERLKLLNKVTFQYSTPFVTDVTLSMLGIRSANNLTYLHLYNCNFTDSSFWVLEKSHPPISDLCLFAIPNVTDDPIIALLRSISGTLTSLQISNCDRITEDVVISGIGRYCRNLKKLSLFPSTDFTIRDLDAIVSIIAPTITRLRNLEKLRIRVNPNLTPDDVSMICCGCYKLQEFFFGRSEYLNDDFVHNYNLDGRKKPLIVLGP